MFRTMSQGDSDSVALRKLLQGGRRGSQAIYKFATKGAGRLILKIRYQVQEFSILCTRRCKNLSSLNSFLPYAPQLSGANPVSLFTLLLAFPQLLSNQLAGGSICWIIDWGAHIYIWRLEIAFGCDISCLLIW